MNKILIAIVLLLVASVADAREKVGTLVTSGDSDELTCNSGLATIHMYDGTWNSGSVNLMYQIPGGSYEEVRVDGTAVTFTQDDDKVVDMPGRHVYILQADATFTSAGYYLVCANRR